MDSLRRSDGRGINICSAPEHPNASISFRTHAATHRSPARESIGSSARFIHDSQKHRFIDIANAHLIAQLHACCAALRTSRLEEKATTAVHTVSKIPVRTSSFESFLSSSTNLLFSSFTSTRFLACLARF